MTRADVLDASGDPESADALANGIVRHAVFAIDTDSLATVTTVNGYTVDEDSSEAYWWCRNWVDPDEPVEVLADRAVVAVREFVTLADLEACLP